MTYRYAFELYLLTVAIETPILFFGLGREHSRARRIFAGFWLNACSHPMVTLVFPALFDYNTDRVRYLLLSETWAPAAECLIFWLAYRPLRQPARDMICIVLANLASFGLGELFAWVRVVQAAAGH